MKCNLLFVHSSVDERRQSFLGYTISSSHMCSEVETLIPGLGIPQLPPAPYGAPITAYLRCPKGRHQGISTSSFAIKM